MNEKSLWLAWNQGGHFQMGGIIIIIKWPADTVQWRMACLQRGFRRLCTAVWQASLHKARLESVQWKYLHYFERWLKHFVRLQPQSAIILGETHGGTWQKINHCALKSAVVAVFITETLHAAYKNTYNVYHTWMPARLNINTICVHIISMLIRSITADIVLVIVSWC